jgi:hypothetical protein
MKGARLAFNRRADVWRAWLGFNLSHSLGLFLFGAGVLVLVRRRFELFAGSLDVQVATVLVAAAYFVLALRFWFWGPAFASAVGLLCLLASALLAGGPPT